MVNTNSIPSDIAYAEVPQINTGITIVDNVANPLLAAQTAAQAASVNPMQIWITLGNWIWLVGIAALLIYSFVSLLRLRSNLVGAIKWYDNIFLADHIASPPTDAQWNLPEEADEYEKIRDSITVSYGELDEISNTDLETLSTQADAAAASYSNISFYMDNAEAAARAFVSEKYGELLMNLLEDNRFAVTDYEVLNFSLGETSNNAVSGEFTFAVKPIQGAFYAGLNEGPIDGINTDGYEDWTIQTKSFTLERNSEGYWSCAKLENIYDTTSTSD